MKWVQLSDIHFNFDNFDTNALRDNLISTLKELPDVDFLVITGDVLYKYGESEEEIQSAINFISNIKNACGIEKKHIYLTPGNHDINQRDTDRNKMIANIRRRKKLELKNNEEEKLYLLGHDRFKRLYRRVIGKEYKPFSVQVFNNKICLVNIDSCLLSKDKKDDKVLNVCGDGLTTINNKIGNGNRLNLVLMHHGVDFFHPVAQKQFQHWADNNYIDLVLCGHSHRAGLRTYDETVHEIKQITCGAALMDDYAIPSFYLYDFNEKEWKIRIELYTFSDSGNWVLDGQHLRAFAGGVYEYCVPRKYDRILKVSESAEILYLESVVENQRQFLNQLDLKFVELYGEIIESSKGGKSEIFSTKKMLKSLMVIEIPIDKALTVINNAVERVTRADFIGSGKNGKISTGDIRTCIYNAICNLSASDGEGITNLQVNDWAGKYARRYGHNNRKVKIISNDGSEKNLSYAFVKSLVKDVAKKITGDDTYYNSLPGTELEFMHSDVMDFIRTCEKYYFKYDVLCKYVEEMATETPHPWMVNDETREKIMNYNKEVLLRHMKKMQSNKEEQITVLEMIYHSTAIILGLYSNILGCREISCLKILRKSVNFYNEKNKTLPMKRHSVTEMFNDLRECGFEKKSFAGLLKAIYDESVVNKNLQRNSLKKNVYDLSELALKLLEYKTKGYSDKDLLLPKVRTALRKSSLYTVQHPLRNLKNCFWMNPQNNAIEEQLQTKLNPILVVIWSQETCFPGMLIEYLSKKKVHHRAIVFFKEDGQHFSEEDASHIVGEVFDKYACYFWDEDILKKLVANGELDQMLETMNSQESNKANVSTQT